LHAAEAIEYDGEGVLLYSGDKKDNDTVKIILIFEYVRGDLSKQNGLPFALVGLRLKTASGFF
jgi:hypothetical protein